MGQITEERTHQAEPDATQDLASWLAKRHKSTRIERCDYLAVFLSARPDVIEARTAGYSLKTIWEHMHETGRIPFRYETFLKYARQHITNDYEPAD